MKKPPVDEKLANASVTGPADETSVPAAAEDKSAPVFLTEVVEEEKTVLPTTEATIEEVKEKNKEEAKGGLVNVLKEFMA